MLWEMDSWFHKKLRMSNGVVFQIFFLGIIFGRYSSMNYPYLPHERDFFLDIPQLSGNSN